MVAPPVTPMLPPWLVMENITNPWEYVFCIRAFDVDAFLANYSNFHEYGDPHVCTYGYSFIVSAILGGVLAVLAGYCLLVLLRRFPGSHVNRKLLFATLFLIGGIRGGFSIYYLFILGSVRSTLDMARSQDLFLRTVIPQVAVTDVMTSFVDFLLTIFWLKVLRATMSVPKWVMVAIGLVICGTLAAILAVDMSDALITFDRTFIFIGVILGVSAVLHFVVIVNVAFKLYTFRYIVSPTLNWHFYRVLSIAGATMICWFVRSIALFLHKSIPPTSSFSLEDATFTLIYFDILMVLPIIVIAGVFWRLSMGLIESQQAEVAGPDDIQHEERMSSQHLLHRVVPSLYNKS